MKSVAEWMCVDEPIMHTVVRWLVVGWWICVPTK